MHELSSLLVVARHAESTRNVAKAGQVFFPDPEARLGLEGEADHHAGLTDVGREQAGALGGRQLAGKRVLLVTHAGVVRMIWFLLEGWTVDEAPARWREEPVGNASFVAYGASSTNGDDGTMSRLG